MVEQVDVTSTKTANYKNSKMVSSECCMAFFSIGKIQ